jgi:WD40 repeat protein
LWDLTGKEVAVLRGHEREVCSAVFSPDGTMVLSASLDKTARLWDLTGKEVAVLRGHEGGVLSAVFSPDGTMVLTASFDKTARLWLVHTKDLLALADSRITRDFTPEEREKYKDLLPEPAEAGK